MLKLNRLSGLLSKLDCKLAVMDSSAATTMLPLRVRSVAATTAATPPKGDMFSKEASLPPLPVPPLQQTMEKYLKSLEPISFEGDLADTEKIVADFAKPGGVGELLQSKLIEKSEQCENWLAEWWDNCAYYGYRDSVVINSSPGVAFEHQTFYSDVDQFRFTAKLIHSVLKFKDMVDFEMIPPDMQRKDPLTMNQYTKLLSECRQPLPKLDRSLRASREESRHVIVAHNNHFYSLDVYKEGTEIPLSEVGNNFWPLSSLYHYLKLIYTKFERSVEIDDEWTIFKKTMGS